MQDLPPLLLTLLFIILLTLSGLFSATEIAFFSLRPARVRLLLNKKRHGAVRVHQLLQKPEELLITILIGNNIVNTFTASLAALITTHWFGSAGLGIATGVITFLILVFGEITPKAFAQKNNEWLALHLAPYIVFLTIFFTPIVWSLRIITQLLLKPFHKKLPKSSRISKEELKSLSRLAHEAGSVDPEEHELVERVLNFSNLKIKDIFVPIHKVTLLNGRVPVEQIVHFMVERGFSRYVVYDKDEDDIIGYVHANDVMRVLNSDQREILLKEVARPITHVDREEPVERIFRMMKRTREHIIIVTGTQLQPLGIVTVGDILEELVGDIEDEIDIKRKKKKKH